MITMEDIIREGHPTLRKAAEEVPMPPSDEDKKRYRSCLIMSRTARIPR